MQETARHARTASFVINLHRWRTGRKRRGGLGTWEFPSEAGASREAAKNAVAQIPTAATPSAYDPERAAWFCPNP